MPFCLLQSVTVCEITLHGVHWTMWWWYLSIRMPTTSSAWARRIMNSKRNWKKNRKKLRTRKTERKKIKKKIKIRKRKPTRWKTSWWNWRAFRTASYVWLRIHRASLRPFFQRMEKVCIICQLLSVDSICGRWICASGKPNCYTRWLPAGLIWKWIRKEKIFSY